MKNYEHYEEAEVLEDEGLIESMKRQIEQLSLREWAMSHRRAIVGLGSLTLAGGFISGAAIASHRR